LRRCGRDRREVVSAMVEQFRKRARRHRRTPRPQSPAFACHMPDGAFLCVPRRAAGCRCPPPPPRGPSPREGRGGSAAGRAVGFRAGRNRGHFAASPSLPRWESLEEAAGPLRPPGRAASEPAHSGCILPRTPGSRSVQPEFAAPLARGALRQLSQHLERSSAAASSKLGAGENPAAANAARWDRPGSRVTTNAGRRFSHHLVGYAESTGGFEFDYSLSGEGQQPTLPRNRLGAGGACRRTWEGKLLRPAPSNRQVKSDIRI